MVEVLCGQAMRHQMAVLQPFGETRAAELMEMLRTLMKSHALPPK